MSVSPWFFFASLAVGAAHTPPPTGHTPSQSPETLHPCPAEQSVVLATLPPQSTPVSPALRAPSRCTSAPAASQSPFCVHTSELQSADTPHSAPLMQSAAVPSPHVLPPDAAHLPPAHRRLLHVLGAVQASPSHFSAHEPPQSTPVSSPSRLLSVHEAVAQRFDTQFPVRHMTGEEQASPTAHLDAPEVPHATTTAASSSTVTTPTPAGGEEQAATTTRPEPMRKNTRVRIR